MIDKSRLAINTTRQIIRRPAHRKPGIMDYENLEGWAEIIIILKETFGRKKPKVEEKPYVVKHKKVLNFVDESTETGDTFFDHH